MMIDETNAPIMEPSGKLLFRSKKDLRAHVMKHVCSKRNEKWWQLSGFDPEIISAGKQGNEYSLKRLERAYLKLLNDRINECCTKQIDHQHQLMILPKIPDNPAWKNISLWDRKPILIIKCWTFLENLVIILASRVQNDKIEPYIIKTGYRTSPGSTKKQWLKRESARVREENELNNGSKIIVLANHIQ